MNMFFHIKGLGY